MAKLSHSNPWLKDVLHNGNKHLALGGPHFGNRPIYIPQNTECKTKLNLCPRGDGAREAFDRDFDVYCDEND